MKYATQLDPSEKAPSVIRRITTRHFTSFSLDKLRTELTPTQPRTPRQTRGVLVNDERERYLRAQTRVPLRRMPPIFSPPPGHPGSIPIRRRGGRVGLEAKLRGSLGDAVDKEVLVLVIAVLAHDGAELGQLAVQDARDRVALVHHDLVQPVGEQGDVGRERQGRTRDVRARVHGREVEGLFRVECGWRRLGLLR